ncbi:MAG: acyl-CoA dehydrogenase family protein [Dehalococcoidia bacterium]|nr:acyl-CoA dehydrogenase family protein [Dehalococcoidia bacterium]
MQFGFNREQTQLRAEVKAFVEREFTPEALAEFESGLGPGPAARDFYKKLGARGWLTVSWPKRYGGLEGSHTDQLIVSDELAYHGVKSNEVGSSMVGPTILLCGSEELKDEWLPQISASNVLFALGYTEPNAGSDLASLEMRAVEDGDDYVVNGAKMFNTGTHYADYHWLGARTDPDVPKHKGVSLFIVDLKSPGISVKPLWVLNGRRTNVVYYDNVRVPKRNLVGQKNRGFYHIATALDFERMLPSGGLRRDFHNLVAAVKKTIVDGRPLGKDPMVRQAMAELAAEVDIANLMSYRIVWLTDNGTVPNTESSMQKLYLTELEGRIGDVAMKIFGPTAMLRKGSKWAPADEGVGLKNYLNSYISAIYGGTNEIQRNVIATRGLGLPR